MRVRPVGSLAYRHHTLITEGKCEIIFRFMTNDQMRSSPSAWQSFGTLTGHSPFTSRNYYSASLQHADNSWCCACHITASGISSAHETEPQFLTAANSPIERRGMQLFGRFKILSALLFLAALTIAGGFFRSTVIANEQDNTQESAPAPATPATQSLAAEYDKAIFQKPIAADKLAFLNSFAGSPSNAVVRDKQYNKLLHSVVPDCLFHYGHDMELIDALQTGLSGSALPVQIRGGRYMMVSGTGGQSSPGRGFMWIDLQDGIALGGFFFRPSNGEPSPTLTIFSKQIKGKYLNMSQLPVAFAEDVKQWAKAAQVPYVEPRYFITDAGYKIVLEHDEDYCDPLGGSAPPINVCQQMNSDAADADLAAAYYVKQTDHIPNATARLIYDNEQITWIGERDNTCRVGPSPLGCHIRMTQERTHVLMGRPGPSPAPHGHR
jgi:uncharacterized protein YecT (DUF1311 family)